MNCTKTRDMASRTAWVHWHRVFLGLGVYASTNVGRDCQSLILCWWYQEEIPHTPLNHIPPENRARTLQNRCGDCRLQQTRQSFRLRCRQDIALW
jgi:hypothetical protein